MRNIITLTIITIATILFASTSALAAKQCGGASWYALNSKTASGEWMNPNTMTAAHRNLRFGTKVRVTNQRNGRSIIVRINDRGPFIKGRVIDLSKAAAAKLGYLRRGHTPVCIEKVG
ncbi:MAG: septal ring lytic transglycosylase RlpA family protein [Pseudomonadota bacterium]